MYSLHPNFFDLFKKSNFLRENHLLPNYKNRVQRMKGFSNNIELGYEFFVKLIQMSTSGLSVELGTWFSEPDRTGRSDRENRKSG